MKIFVFLSEIIGKTVVDCRDQRIGRLCDIPMKISDEVYPKTIGLVVKRGVMKSHIAYVDSDQIQEIDHVIRLKCEADDIKFESAGRKYDFTLCNDILDQQVVDTDNQKVVRVNDIHLLKVDNQMYLAHVDVGLRGLIRRMEWAPLVDWLVRLFKPESPYLTEEEFIPWKHTQVLSLGRIKNVLRLSGARKKLSQIPAIELAEIMEDLDIFEKLSLFKSLDVAMQRKVFTDLNASEQEEIIDQLNEKEAVDLLQNIPADEATDLLSHLPKDKTIQLMRGMETETSKMLRKLLGFAKDSAGGLMTTEYLYLPETATVKDALKKIKENANFPGNIFHIYIVDKDHRLVGSTSMRRFINAEEDMSVLDACYPKKVFVRIDDGMEEIALLLEKYKFSSIPVLNENDVLQGVITSDDVMEELISLTWGKYKEKL